MIFVKIIISLLRLLEILIFVEVILSWVMVGKENDFTIVIHKITAPFLEPGRKLQEKLFPGLMVDFSPFIALVIIAFLRRILW
jgi:YggT family protein